MKTEKNQNRQKHVKSLVTEMYENSKLPSAQWMWETHVPVVAEKAEKIATREVADLEQVVSASLLHDIADTKLLRSDEEHEDESEIIARKVLAEAGFSQTAVDAIVTDILQTHSAYPENMPQTLEAKVVATADAYGHLGTQFYTDMTVERLSDFGIELTAEEYRQWVLKKIERDFRSKIFFDKEREELRSAYEEIKQRFS